MSSCTAFDFDAVCASVSFQRPKVWHATWHGSEVAAKAISLEHLPKTYRERAFKGVELNVLGTLNHPHITHIYRVYCVVADEEHIIAVPGATASEDDIPAEGSGNEEIKELWIVMVNALTRALPAG